MRSVGFSFESLFAVRSQYTGGNSTVFNRIHVSEIPFLQIDEVHKILEHLLHLLGLFHGPWVEPRKIIISTSSSLGLNFEYV